MQTLISSQFDIQLKNKRISTVKMLHKLYLRISKYFLIFVRVRILNIHKTIKLKKIKVF